MPLTPDASTSFDTMDVLSSDLWFLKDCSTNHFVDVMLESTMNPILDG